MPTSFFFPLTDFPPPEMQQLDVVVSSYNNLHKLLIEQYINSGHLECRRKARVSALTWPASSLWATVV